VKKKRVVSKVEQQVKGPMSSDLEYFDSVNLSSGREREREGWVSE
jgi:hypothetical protein